LEVDDSDPKGESARPQRNTGRRRVPDIDVGGSGGIDGGEVLKDISIGNIPSPSQTVFILPNLIETPYK
jgi:hypothetical protein